MRRWKALVETALARIGKIDTRCGGHAVGGADIEPMWAVGGADIEPMWAVGGADIEPMWGRRRADSFIGLREGTRIKRMRCARSRRRGEESTSSNASSHPTVTHMPVCTRNHPPRKAAAGAGYWVTCRNTSDLKAMCD